MIKNLKYYCKTFEKLRRDYKNGGAPHKPVLLISLIQAFQQKIYTTNQITITPELVGLFKSNWSCLVTSNHTCLFTLPFYHMSTEPFWTLVPNPGCEIWVQSKSSMSSFSNLTTAIKYALIDNELVELLRSKDDSEMILHFLLETYFSETKGKFLISGNNYISEIESQISEDNREEYARRILKIKEELNSEEFQEEMFIRGSLFKREIPKIYNNTCAISGMRIDAVDNISMIDACHIVPFSESYDDTLPNGIALCPNLHRAFDRGLIFINDEYRVVVNKNFVEPYPSKYSIGQFDNIKILTPILEYHHPAKEALAWHMKKWSFTKVN